MSERPVPHIPIKSFVDPALNGTTYVRISPQDMETIKQMIAQQVQTALHPALPGLPDVYHFIQVEAKDQDGKKWRGMLYAVQEEKG